MSEEVYFENNVVLNTVIGNMSTRFGAGHSPNSIFNVLWLLTEFDEDRILNNITSLQAKSENDIGLNIHKEIIHLKSIYKANLEMKLS